jgi:hypothetical protein
MKMMEGWPRYCLPGDHHIQRFAQSVYSKLKQHGTQELHILPGL